MAVSEISTYMNVRHLEVVPVLVAGLAAAFPSDPQLEIASAQLVRRGTPANQPHGYAPQINTCPSDAPTIREASQLSSEEQAWLPTRRNATIPAMRDLLIRANISGFDAGSYIDRYTSNSSALPNIGIAISGGGYRAQFNGAGAVSAFDNRTVNSTSAGQLGGLLQSATYLSALSGGGWLVGSLYTNNFTSVQSILAQPPSDENDLWQVDNTIFEGPSANGHHFLSGVDYWGTLLDQVNSKSDQGFNTTITDYWGRALSFQLINATDGGPAYTFSSIATQDWFTSGTAPLPILISDGRAPDQTIVSSNSTIFEFNPWELGSFDPTTYAFAPLKYVGTNFSAGSVASTSSCVTGFDSASFIMGTSSSLFNAAFTTLNGTSTSGLLSSAIQHAVTAILQKWGDSGTDIASYPNPFYHYNNQTDPGAVSVELTLTDGGEDGQNVPLYPLTQPIRQVDVVFAVDSSADSTDTNPANGSASSWPLGTSLIKTYQRSMSAIANGTVFPAIPDENTFVNLGLNNRPTFFGCDPANLTGPAPLIVYIPNAPYSYYGNTSTYQLDYNDTERNAVINNGYNSATQGNGTLNADWPKCVGCAILSRSFNRTGTSVPQDCQQCFQKYCWNGTIASQTPAPYTPSLKLGSVNVNGGSSSGSSGSDSGSNNSNDGKKGDGMRWSAPLGLAAICLAAVMYVNI